MFGLPKTTEFNKKIPKQKFYEKLDVTPELKRIFIDNIKVIYWVNKLAASTTNLAIGKTVTEIEFFEISLSKEPLDISALRLMDRQIPYHIIFILEYKGRYQVWTAYKEVVTSGNKAFNVGSYFHSDWCEPSNLIFKLKGLDLDTVYENLVRSIAGDILQKPEGKDETLKESVERQNLRQNLQKQIEKLRNKIFKEKQINKQFELSNQLKKLQRQLDST